MHQMAPFTESRAIQYQGTCSDNHFFLMLDMEETTQQIGQG
jgi:hypothetical protein